MMPRRLRRFGLLLASATLLSAAAVAQEGFGPLQPDLPTGKTPEQIVAAMGAREA